MAAKRDNTKPGVKAAISPPSPQRSWNMSRIRSGDTQPEKAVRSMLHHLGLRFRLRQRKLPGTPDIVLPHHHTVIMVHGCFWHRHEECRLATVPKANAAFWQDKFKKNIERDKRVTQELELLGWRVLVVWECELLNPKVLNKRLQKAFGLLELKDNKDNG